VASKTSITVMKEREEVERLWRDPRLRPDHAGDDAMSVRFIDAPGDRGTEIHVELTSRPRGGKLGTAVQKLAGTEPLAQVKNEMRRFKQLVETGVIARSDASPQGEQLKRKVKQRPAQPLSESEREKVGV
jgi:hypothetical protein